MIKLNKIVFSIMLLFIIINTVNAGIGIYDNEDKFTYYTNKISPELKINIKAFETSLDVKNATIFIDGELKKTYEISEEKKVILANTNQTYNFITDYLDLSNLRNNNVYFKLNVKIGQRNVQPLGDKTEFYLKYDNLSPKLESFSYSNKQVMLKFNKDIAKIQIKINNKTIEYSNINLESKLKKEKSQEIKINVAPIINEDDETLNFEVTYIDLVEQKAVDTKRINNPKEPFSMKLLTLSDENNLKYFYNIEDDFRDLFNGTIYSNAEQLTLKIKTNKAGICYKSIGSVSDPNLKFTDIDAKTPLTTQDDYLHTVEMSSDNVPIWIACQNKYNPEDILYLHTDYLKINKLPRIKQYSQPTVKLISEYPLGTITENPYNIQLKTENPAVCFYDNKKLNSLDLINHNSEEIDRKGTYDIVYTCYDRLNKKQENKYKVTIDPTKGVIIDLVKPAGGITNKNVEDIEVKISNPTFNCKYTQGSVLGYTDKFYDFTNTTISEDNSAIRKFTLMGLKLNEDNYFHIICKNEINGDIFKEKLSIIYTDGKIELKNFSFLNGEIRSKYLGDSKNIKFEFLASSALDMKANSIVKFLDGKSETFDLGNVIKNELTTKTISSSKNLSSSTLLTLNISNLFNKVQQSQNIYFDFDKPILEMKKIEEGFVLNCKDIKSGCYKILYAFSQNKQDCNPLKEYINGTIKIGEDNFFCAKAIDNAGNINGPLYEMLVQPIVKEEEKEEVITEEEEIPKVDEFVKEEIKEEIPDEEVFTQDNIEEKTTNTTPYVVASAIALLLAGISGGGYYAYKKGYLDKELEKLGILKPKNNSQDYYKTVVNTPSQSIKPVINKQSEPQNKEIESASSYDKYLNKLNRFMNDKIGKSKDKFGEFGKTNKGKVEGYNDTLTKKQEESKNYDMFYDKKTSSVNKLEDMNISDNDAQSFEEYYKNKKK